MRIALIIIIFFGLLLYGDLNILFAKDTKVTRVGEKCSLCYHNFFACHSSAKLRKTSDHDNANERWGCYSAGTNCLFSRGCETKPLLETMKELEEGS
jgi:hypothetical protein